MRNSRGRRGEENDESSGNVKLDEVGDILSGGAGAKVEAREGGRGKKKMPARKSAHLLNSRGV